jgi:hypothetical protein
MWSLRPAGFVNQEGILETIATLLVPAARLWI